jgi:hypothetical protein
MLGCECFTYRRFKVLLARLPQESEFVQAVGGEIVRWDRKDHRFADIIDLLVQLNHNYVQVHTPKRRLKVPKPMRRPGFEAKPSGRGERHFKGRAIPLAELKALTEKWRKGGDDGGS